jgi:hypothetical protein
MQQPVARQPDLPEELERRAVDVSFEDSSRPSSVESRFPAPRGFTDSRFADSRFAESRFAESRFAESRFAESRFAESRFAASEA